MNRSLFLERMKTSTPMEREKIDRVLRDSIESNSGDGNPRGHRNLIIVMEELSELTKEISKELRGKGDRDGIIEELADVILGIYYVQEILGIDNESIKRAVAVKTERLASILYDTGKFE